eukprot:751683-Hanusia_phi.AAC.3
MHQRRHESRMSYESSVGAGRKGGRAALEDKSTGITPTFRSLDVGRKGGTLLDAMAAEPDRGAVSARLTLEQVLEFLTSEIKSRFATTIPEPAELLDRNKEQASCKLQGEVQTSAPPAHHHATSPRYLRPLTLPRPDIFVFSPYLAPMSSSSKLLLSACCLHLVTLTPSLLSYSFLYFCLPLHLPAPPSSSVLFLILLFS